MTVKQLRKRTGLSQAEFAKRYRIPLQTLKQWECNPDSTSFRRPPAYVVHMLERLTSHDFGSKPAPRRTRAEALMDAAEESRGDAKLWLRYLRKEFDGDQIKLAPEDLEQLMASDRLAMYQKLILKRAAVRGTATHDCVTGLNRPAGTPMLAEIARRHAGAS